MIPNQELELAWDFVEKTDRNIFLTGKAGTGKTTFLHKIKHESLKRLVVVAPTGVAAINAKGVTIHSFFQLAFGPILPAGFQIQESPSYKMKFGRQKIDIIRSLDLLIIDEVSMVRADLLDGIDQVLRRYRNRDKVFGGIQVVMIGDLQQLSPVVKPNEWELLKTHYDTPYFFSSKSFQKANTMGIELKHIYRQDNEKFIAILNEIRNNTLSKKSKEILNERYSPDFVPEKDAGYITLTTHNSRARRMNDVELNKIKTESYFYSAKIIGKFNEHAYPTQEDLELKKGAQVMFIKNDSDPEKRYFNGKIGKIISLDKDEVTVVCPDDEYPIVTTPETWENIKYSIDNNTHEIAEDKMGSFTQMPFRLAWAITIHKSQGLTFDKVVIDAEASFAHGQTYVALSRCRTLEGIVLQNKISEKNIISDNRVVNFSENVKKNPPTSTDLQEAQKSYQLNLIEELFNYRGFLYPVKRCLDMYYQNNNSIQGEIVNHLNTIKDNGIVKLLQIGSRFKNQLNELSTDIDIPQKSPIIQARITKAITYFIEHTNTHIKTPLQTLHFSTDNKEIKKNLNKQLNKIEEQLSNKLFCLKGLKDRFNTEKYLELRAEAVLQDHKSNRKKEKHIATTEHEKLFDELRELRVIISQAENIPLYQVFTQLSLYEMCRYFPVTEKQLRAINGMGKVRIKKYGKEIIEIIVQYVEDMDLVSREVEKDKKPKKEKGSSQKESFKLFKQGLSISEIAKKRDFAISTIEGHLSQFVSTGEIDVTELISKKKYETLKKLMEKTTYKGFGDLKGKIDSKFTYGEIRIVALGIEYKKKI